MKRFAFTILELVFVIMAIGILAVLAMPSFNIDPLGRAAEQVAGHIRYTQHLAMVDDKYEPFNPLDPPSAEDWYKKRWQIRFLSNGTTRYYDIFTDINKLGNSGDDEEALDPLTKLRLGSGNTFNTPTDAVNLTDRYGITNISGTCVTDGTNKLGFDYLGRPYLGVSDGIYSNPVPAGGCTIVLQHATEGNATITVAAETGYVSISY